MQQNVSAFKHASFTILYISFVFLMCVCTHLTLCALLHLCSHNRLSRQQFYLLLFGCWLQHRTHHHCSHQKLLLWGKASATTQKVHQDKNHAVNNCTWDQDKSSSFIRTLTVSSQKRSKSSFLCCLLRVMSQRPPFLFLSSSHMGSMPSCNA